VGNTGLPPAINPMSRSIVVDKLKKCTEMIDHFEEAASEKFCDECVQELAVENGKMPVGFQYASINILKNGTTTGENYIVPLAAVSFSGSIRVKDVDSVLKNVNCYKYHLYYFKPPSLVFLDSSQTFDHLNFTWKL
jgi:hypothetical protein